MKLNQISKTLLLVVACLSAGVAQAGIIVGGTRVIYDGGKREASLSVKNPDNVPYLIQTWADAEGASGENKGAAKPPFIVTPPLFRLDANKENLVRIIRSGGTLPGDRESIYWMNVKSIPGSAKGDKNTLQIAVKTRLKLIYRPEGLKAPGDDDYKKVTFQRAGSQIQVSNPTPYYLSFYSMNVGNTVISTTNVMVPPKGSASYPVPSAASGAQVSWKVINDFGGSSEAVVSPLH